MSGKSAYAKAGVDYTVMEPFKQAMISAGKRTLKFPNKSKIIINSNSQFLISINKCKEECHHKIMIMLFW